MSPTKETHWPDPADPEDDDEVRPRFQELDNPGLEVCKPSDLEVVVPPPRRVLSLHKTWENLGGLPETPGGRGYSPAPLTAQSYNTVAPAYDYFEPYDERLLAPPPVVGDFEGRGRAGEGRILGIRRQAFWIVLAIAVFVVVSAVAVGVGLGLGLRTADEEAVVVSSPTTTTTSPTSRAFPIPTAQAVTNTPGQDITCPTHNLTLYTSKPHQTRRFTLLCGRDYSSERGSTDILDQDAETMSECIDLCAAEPRCVGAGWGYKGGRYTCWLKSQLATVGWAPVWYFAVLDNETVPDALPTATARAEPPMIF